MIKKPFKRIVLPSGMRVLLVPQKASLATTVSVIVEAGSKYETKEINGISHFLEHMCFKGTTKRPRPIDIAGELDSLGAQYNAFTSQEYTSYYAKVRNDSAEKALEIVADLYLNPTFDPKEIEKEKGVIIEEINMYEDMPTRKVDEVFAELVYGDQPAGWSIAGTKEVIQKIAQNDFLKYRGAHYLANTTTLVVAGGFDEKKILNAIKKEFSSLHKGKKERKVKVIEIQSKPEEKIFWKASDQTHLVMGFRAFDVFDERRFSLQVLSDILGGGMGSRLFRRIREELGAAYYVRASADLLSDHGLLTMSAGVNHGKLDTVIQTGLEEFHNLKTTLVSKEELQRSKDHLIGNLFLSLETSDEIGYFYGGQEIFHKPLITPETLAKKIKAVTAKEIQDVAKDLFRQNSLNLAVIGPFRGKSFRDILKI